jgi:hypothetical protein
MLSVGADCNGYIGASSTFFGLTASGLTAKAAATLIGQRASFGATPIKTLIIVGHSWNTSNQIGGSSYGCTPAQIKANSLIRESLKFTDLAVAAGYAALEENIWRIPTFANAVDIKLPPGCWFRKDASIRLVGCQTFNMAFKTAGLVLRGNAKAWGTKFPTWVFPGLRAGTFVMGWGDLRGGRWFGDADKGKAGTPSAYFTASPHAKNWGDQDARN